jgi:DNA mismatch repair protein MutL
LFGKNSFIIQGVPADILHGNEKHSIELLIEQFNHFSNELKFSKREKLIHCMARQQAIKAGQALSEQEMKAIVEELFQCKTPAVTPNGNSVFVEFNDEQLLKMFGKV